MGVGDIVSAVATVAAGSTYDIKPTAVREQWLIHNIAVEGSPTNPVASAPTVTPNGAGGTTTYGYRIIAFNANGDCVPSAEGTTSTGSATLSAANSNTVTWAQPTDTQTGNILGFKVIRSTSGGSPASVGLVATLPWSVTSFTDTGVNATPYALSTANPGIAAPWCVYQTDGTTPVKLDTRLSDTLLANMTHHVTVNIWLQVKNFGEAPVNVAYSGVVSG